MIEPAHQTCRDAPSVLELRWSRRKIRSLALMVSVAAMASIPLIQAADEGVRIIGLIWIGLLSLPLIDLYRRQHNRDPVIVIDSQGILDRRILARPIGWWEISCVLPANVEQGHVVELRLRHPDCTFSACDSIRRKLWAPIDACLRRIGLPDVCLNLLLVDACPTQLLSAIGRHRPDLLPLEHRALLTPCRPARLREAATHPTRSSE